MRRLKILEINSEIGAGTRGASLGVEAMKVASLNAKSDFFYRYPTIKVPNRNDVLFGNTDQSHAKNIEALTEVYLNLMDTLQGVLEGGHMPIVLAGDHSSAAGTIAGIKRTYPGKRLGVIWIDAHTDLHSPYTTPSGNMHGMPLAIALGEDNKEKASNEVSGTTLERWEALKCLSGDCPMIQYRDLIFVGLRDTEEEEDHLIEKHNIKIFSVTEVRLKGVYQIVREINKYLSGCDLIYVSFDVDSLDCEYVSYGTGTPVPVGFSEGEMIFLLEELLLNEKVCCLEVVEINPTLDNKCNRMAETAFRILCKSVNILCPGGGYSGNIGG